ncbi:hypothetical protein ACHAXS_003025 [Conticribra weissflogii]
MTNRPSHQSSRRSDFALLNIDLVEEPESFSDEHLHDRIRNVEIDLETDDYDFGFPVSNDCHDDDDDDDDEDDAFSGRPRVHEPSWGNRRRHRHRRIRQSSLVSDVTFDSFVSSQEEREDPLRSSRLADVLGHSDGVASSSSFLSDDDLLYLPLGGRDSVSLAVRRGVPKPRHSRREDDDGNEVLFRHLADGDSVSLARRRGVPSLHRGCHKDGGDDEREREHERGSLCDRASDELLLAGRDSLSVARARYLRERRSTKQGNELLRHDDYDDDYDDGYDDYDDELLVSWPTKH